MSVSLPTQTMIYLATPIISKIAGEIIESAISSDNLGKVKDSFIDVVGKITGSNDWQWDDAIAGKVIAKLEEPEFYQKWGDKLLDPIETWIAATETKWDDRLLLPAIIQFREACNIPDND